jgi:hypothetical protein
MARTIEELVLQRFERERTQQYFLYVQLSHMVGLPNCAWYDTARAARLLKRVQPMLNTL